MISFPNAKINLGLQVVEKRPDGFHNLESVFYPVGLCDALELRPGERQEEGVRLTVTGLKIPGKPEDNLCVRAYHLLKKDHYLHEVEAHLHKVIPTGAGLGGGSSDAVHFIKLLDKKFDLNLSWGELHHYARHLGSDCSFFVGNQPSFATGKGDDQEKLDVSLKGYFLVIVHPGIHVSTAEAYGSIVPAKPGRNLKDDIRALPVSAWKGIVKNDFEVPVFKKHPILKSIKEKLYAQGAVYASMSGSGSALFGIFEQEVDPVRAFPDCFVWKEKL